MKYHQPDGQWYDQTDAEVWFDSAESAEKAGFVEAGSPASIEANEAEPRRRRPMSNLYKDHRDVLIAPVVSEKSYSLLDQNKYTFLVHRDSNKTEIKIAVETGLQRQGDQREHAQPGRQAQAHPQSAGAHVPTPSGRSSASPRASASTSSEVRSPDRATVTTDTAKD